MRFDPRLGYNKNRRGKGRKGRNTSFDRTLTNVSRVVGTGVSRDRIRKVGKCDPRIKVMALRGLFPGFQGIKEPPSAEPSLPPIPLSHGPRETTPSNYRFLKPNRTSSTHTHIYKETGKFRFHLETRKDKRRGSSNAFNLRRRTAIVCDRTNGKTSTIISPAPIAPPTPPLPERYEDARTSIEPNDTVINVRAASRFRGISLLSRNSRPPREM